MSEQNEPTRLPARVDPPPPLVVSHADHALALPEEQDSFAAGVRSYANLFTRRKATLLITLAAALGFALLATALTPRTYEATAVLLISEVPKTEAAGPTPGTPVLTAMGSPNLDTHVQLLLGQSTAVDTAEWLRQYGGPALTPEALRTRLRVKAVRDTQLIRVSARGRTPGDAQQVANAAANAYVEANQQRARGSSETTGRYFREQLLEAKQTLTKAQNALRAYRESTGTVTADAEASDLVARAAALQGEADKSSAELAQARGQVNTLRTQLTQANATIESGQVRDDAAIQKLRDRLSDLQAKRLEAQVKYTEKYSEPVARLDDQIAAVRKQLGDEVRRLVHGRSGDLSLQQALTTRLVEQEAEVAATQARRTQVLAELNQAQASLQRIPGRQLLLANLQRDQDVAAGIYADLLKQAQQVEVGRVTALGNAQVAESATRPLLPVKPSLLLNLVIGLLLGLGAGLGLALLQDQMDDSVRDQMEASRLARAPVLGTIPVFPRPESPVLASVEAAHSTALEAYRALRYCLNFITPGARGRAILVTSAAPNEGKSTTVLNLALAVSLAGRKVVLVDTDLRRSALHRMLEVEEGRGLTDVLLGEATLDEVLHHHEKPGLLFIGPGQPAANATELLESAAMRQLLEQLRDRADLVIFDSPPLLSVADTLVLANLADAVLMVCVAGQTYRRDMQLARQLLAHVGERITGVVLNKVGHRPGYTYQNRQYYYPIGREPRSGE